MAASPQGGPSGRRAVITATPEARWLIASRKSWSRVTSMARSAARRRCPQAYACRRAPGRWRGGRCAGGRRGSPRGPGRRRRSGAPAGTGPPSSSRRPAASRTQAGVAPERGAGGLAGEVDARRSAGGRSGGRRRGIAERRQRGAAAEHEALGERVRGQPVGAVQAGAGRLADRVEPGQRRAPVEVAWPRRPSCSARRAPRAAGRGAGRVPPPPSAAAMFGKRATSTARMSSITADARRRARAGPGSPAPPRRAAPARPRSARRPALTQRGALAAHGLGDQEAVARAGRGAARWGGTA